MGPCLALSTVSTAAVNPLRLKAFPRLQNLF